MSSVINLDLDALGSAGAALRDERERWARELKESLGGAGYEALRTRSVIGLTNQALADLKASVDRDYASATRGVDAAYARFVAEQEVQLKRLDLSGTERMLAYVREQQSASIAMLARNGADELAKTLSGVASRFEKQHQDLVNFSARSFGSVDWVERMQPVVGELEVLAASARLAPAFDQMTLLATRGLFGAIDVDVAAALGNAATQDERFALYRDAGADMRLVELPRNLFARAARALRRSPAARTARRHAPPATPLERSFGRGTRVTPELEKAYRISGQVEVELRDDFARAMTRAHGPAWVASHVPPAILKRWEKTARRRGLTPLDDRAWLEESDFGDWKELLEVHWTIVFSYRVSDRDAFFDALKTVGDLRRDTAHFHLAMTEHDVLRLEVAANELLKAVLLAPVVSP